MTALSLSEDIIVEPEPGFWMVRFGPNKPEVPAKIWAVDHEPGNPENKMDRGGKTYFDAELAGERVDPHLVMRARERRPISEPEYRFQVADCAWAREHQPEDPRLWPTRRADVSKLPPVMP